MVVELPPMNRVTPSSASSPTSAISADSPSTSRTAGNDRGHREVGVLPYCSGLAKNLPKGQVYPFEQRLPTPVLGLRHCREESVSGSTIGRRPGVRYILPGDFLPRVHADSLASYTLRVAMRSRGQLPPLRERGVQRTRHLQPLDTFPRIRSVRFRGGNKTCLVP